MMFLQTDSRWANIKINGTQYTLGSDGCFITSLANMVDKTPPEVLEILTNGGGLNGALVISDKAAELLGLDYYGKSTSEPDYDCIAETGYWGGQHFFNLLKDDTQFDPLNKKTDYPIKNYRLFKVNESEDNVNHEVVAETVRKVRRMVLTGTFDTAGAEADITWVENELNKGNKYAFEQLFGRYEKASNYIKTGDCTKYTKGLNEIKSIVNNL